MLSRIEDESEKESGGSARTSRNSLRDRFKLVRMREEAGATLPEDENGQSNIGLGIGSSGTPTEEEEKGAAMARGTSSPGPTTPVKQPTINPNLAPGTASGIAAGPAGDSAVPVDWDLWQSVVYEGPAAVARTSPEELNLAIASGIPQAIRGVVWQVLAQSKNEELEGVYRELVARGTDKERVMMQLPTVQRGDSTGGVNGYGKEKESIASSASSVHSDHSTPATTVTNGTTNAPSGSPTSHGGDSPEAIAKAQAKLEAERKKKAQEEKVALQKLEKTIRRDLGARTSYSKYLMSAGLQDGLFGVCKAYALFDQDVGYAQGMNFIAMPLLFNVGPSFDTPTSEKLPLTFLRRCRKKRHSAFWSV